MGRLKGSINKKPEIRLSTEERLHFLANLIIDRIIEDQTKGQILLKSIYGK